MHFKALDTSAVFRSSVFQIIFLGFSELVDVKSSAYECSRYKMKNDICWNIDELRELIKEKKGEVSLEKTDIHIKSVVWKLNHARYHKFTAYSAFEEQLESSDNEIATAIMLLLNNNLTNKISNISIIAEANAIAYAHCLYSVQDLMAYIIFYVFGFDKYNSKITLTDVCSSINYHPLKNEIQKLTESHRFLYLRDFSNKSKHVSLVESSYSIELIGVANNCGMKFSEFQYKPKHSSKPPRKHKAKWYKEFFEDLLCIEESYLKIGNAINKYLKDNV